MTTSPSGSPPGDEYSLDQIKGIGPTRRQQLQTLLDIATVLDLAEAEAAAIESAFRAAGYSITRANAADWITQARQLIESEPAPPAPQAVDPTAAPGPEPPAAPGVIAEDWQTQATVLLEFQTHGENAIHRWRLLNPASQAAVVLTDQASDSLRDWLQHVDHVVFHFPEDERVSDSLQDWLQQQIPPRPETQAQEQSSPEQALEFADGQQELTVQVREVLLLQPPNTSMPIPAIARNTGFSAPLQMNQPFHIEVYLEFPDLAQRAVPSGLGYRLEGFAKTLTHPHRTIPLGKGLPQLLTSNQTQYRSAIAATGLPSGLYRLQILVASQGVAIPLTIHEISRLQVI